MKLAIGSIFLKVLTKVHTEITKEINYQINFFKQEMTYLFR